MSSRTCPDWPRLMEVAPDLQFMHYTVADPKIAEALRGSHWFDLSDWKSAGPGTASAA
jgi:hypothetical protein